MSTTTYDIGDVAVLDWHVAVNGEAVDPSTVTIDVLAPDGALTHAEWAGGSGQVVRVQPGLYRFFVTTDTAGIWWARWSGAGDVEAADEASFDVRRRRVQTP